MVLSEIGVPAGEPGASIVIQSVGLWDWQAFSLPTDPCISKSAGPNEGLVSSPRRQWMRASSGDAELFFQFLVLIFTALISFSARSPG